MCQSHPGPEITQEYLNSLAALANYTLPTPAALRATALPNGWEPVPGGTLHRYQRRRRRRRNPPPLHHRRERPQSQPGLPACPRAVAVPHRG